MSPLRRSARAAAWRLSALGLLLLLPPSGGCVRGMAINALADSLASEGGAWARDDDPELVADATAFGLKTIESLLDAEPEHPKLLLAATRNFTQYAYAFLQMEADYIEEADEARAERLRQRALRMYRRAIGYGLRGLGGAPFEATLRADPQAAVAKLDEDKVGLLYWTAVAWGASVALNKDDPEMASGLQGVDVMLKRAVALNAGYGQGALYDFLVSWDASRPESAGGSMARAAEHLERSKALSGGARLSPLLAYAEGVTVPKQERARFEALIAEVLAFDVDSAPQHRLNNLITQRRARWLKAHADDLFVD
ncbi:TRAP transporter TatT component family protein [Myxococcota bacterium]|nr:TRAP transporter TatT component family protein [Myxococcota bacterium]MBU1432158.1 TRAP transporter TatT component family protein [Myxococcota bacterium]MBU1899708.1 TRAP transporter TatT component family protein [Myxococcota bacterium]